LAPLILAWTLLPKVMPPLLSARAMLLPVTDRLPAAAVKPVAVMLTWLPLARLTVPLLRVAVLFVPLRDKVSPVPPVTVDPKLPQLLNDLILMSVAKDPGERFQTAAAFRNALGNVAPAAQPAAKAAAVTTAPVTPAAAVKGDFHLIEPTKPPQPKGRRGLWMALGAVAVVLALVAAVEFGPWKGTKAAPQAVPQVAQHQEAPAQRQETAAPVPPPVSTQATPPAAQPMSLPATPAPQKASMPATQPAAPAREAQTRKLTPPPQPTQAGTPVSSPAAVLQPAPQVPAQQQPVQQQPAQSPAQQAGARAPAASREELQQAREQLATLGVRAAGIRTSLQTLQRSQAASGLNLRGDMQEASSLMTTYLEGANAALNDGNPAQAKSFMDKAERQVEKLEKFLNR